MMPAMSNPGRHFRGKVRLASLVLLQFTAVAFAQTASTSSKPDYSQEPYVIETLVSRVVFENDGTGTRDLELRARIQADAAVQQSGVLTFAYAKANDNLEIAYVRVRKPSGALVVTPAADIQDIESEISRAAPMYSDFREKHVAVKGLAVGDTLEYRVTWHTHTPQVPGQFAFEYNFAQDGIVLDEQLELSLPKAREVTVKSADVQPKISDDGTRRIYTWKTKQLSRKTDDEKSKKAKKDKPSSVEITSFRTWEEVGKWYAELQRERSKPTPEIRAKAAELTAKSTSNLEKVRAIYHYVSTEFRYISLSFGIGRLQPHAAGEVLANGYGDCKDKHTLLASLLEASGFATYPVLVNSSRRIDDGFPSLSQFDHMISQVKLPNEIIWLDTTPEVAPFGLLLYPIQNKKGLLVSDKPQLVTTPGSRALKYADEFTFEGTLRSDGVLNGTIHQSYRGDAEVIFRSAFRRTPRPQWKELAQRLSHAIGFAGTVDNLEVSSPVATEEPFTWSYSYNRKDLPDWANHRILAALPAFFLPNPDDGNKSGEPIELGATKEVHYRSKIQLPPGYTPEVPAKLDLINEFAEYHSTSGYKDGWLTVERVLVTKKNEVPSSARDDWKKFVKTIDDETNTYISVKGENDSQTQEANQQYPVDVFTGRDAEAMRLFQNTQQLGQRGDFAGVIENIHRVLSIDPKFPRAWLMIGYANLSMRRNDDAMDAFRKEMELNPNDDLSLRQIATAMIAMGQRKSAIEVYKKLLKVAPKDLDAALNLGSSLLASERYSEAVTEMEPLVKLHPDNERLLEILGNAYLNADQKEKGIATLEKAIEVDPKPSNMNDVAYELASSNVNLDKAEQWAIKAVEAEENEAASIALQDLEPNDLGHMGTLSAYWDTLGWVYYQKGDLQKAERYLKASWELMQRWVVGDHLGQVYEKTGKLELASQTYGTAMSAGNASEELRHRYQRLTEQHPALGRKVAQARPTHGAPSSMSGADALSQMRTIRLPKITSASGSAEYFVLIRNDGKPVETKFISGLEALRDAGKALANAKYPQTFPEGSKARIVRRGIVMCQPFSGCNIVLMPVDTVRTVN